jgi:hypothetical protein
MGRHQMSPLSQRFGTGWVMTRYHGVRLVTWIGLGVLSALLTAGCGNASGISQGSSASPAVGHSSPSTSPIATPTPSPAAPTAASLSAAAVTKSMARSSVTVDTYHSSTDGTIDFSSKVSTTSGSPSSQLRAFDYGANYYSGGSAGPSTYILAGPEACPGTTSVPEQCYKITINFTDSHGSWFVVDWVGETSGLWLAQLVHYGPLNGAQIFSYS